MNVRMLMNYYDYNMTINHVNQLYQDSKHHFLDRLAPNTYNLSACPLGRHYYDVSIISYIE